MPVFCKRIESLERGQRSTPVSRGGVGAGATSVTVRDPAAVPARTQLFIGCLNRARLAVTRGRPGSVERLVPTCVHLTCGTDRRG
ncbi:hypothetical protein [Streptomyces sp. NPDC006446]|uniref:hypothetical protein n=1 Tax=Streptomyces sp. NPDC006446 TaxID=3154301 RepID=UPI0033A865ED